MSLQIRRAPFLALTLLVAGSIAIFSSSVRADRGSATPAPSDTGARPDGGPTSTMGPELTLNLAAFGADNTGRAGSEAGNYEAFQRAVAELCKVTRTSSRFCGGVISLPPGVYKINRTITISDEITIRGAGVGTEIQWTGPMTTAENGGVQPVAFNFTGAPHRYTANAGMQDLRLRGTSTALVNAAAAGLSVGISFAPEVAPGSGFKPPLGFPLLSVLSNVYVFGFGTGIRIGVLDGAATTIPWGFTMTNVEAFHCTIGVDLQAGNAIYFYDLRAEGCLIGFWHQSGSTNAIFGGVIQGDWAGLVVTADEEFRIESVYFEADYGGELTGGEVVRSQNVPAGQNLAGGSIVLQPMLGGTIISGFTAADCSFATGPAPLPDGGVLETRSNISLIGSDDHCPMSEIHFENLQGHPYLNFSPSCDTQLYAGGIEGHGGGSPTLSIVNSSVGFTRDQGPYWKSSARWKPIPVFEVSGFDPRGESFTGSRYYGMPSVKVQDNGTLDVRAINFGPDGGYLEPAIIASGVDDVDALGRTPHSGNFHALDLRHARTDSCNNGPACQSIAGDTVDVRFMVNGSRWKGDDRTSSAMIQVINTGDAEAPRPDQPVLAADMAFSTAGSLPHTAGSSNEGEQERMRITHDGRVGIGTTAPKATLDVAGTLRLETSRSPKSGDACAVGEMAWDSAYVYVCVAASTWRRSALSSY